MSNEEQEFLSEQARASFVRWQGRTTEQLGFVNNLFIGLATGLLAFQTNLAFDDKTHLTAVEKIFVVPSMILIALSLMLGCYVAWNRLGSFRITTKIAKKRENNESKVIDKLRKSTRSKDKYTWCILMLQTISFGLGGLFLLVASMIRYLK